MSNITLETVYANKYKDFKILYIKMFTEISCICILYTRLYIYFIHKIAWCTYLRYICLYTNFIYIIFWAEFSYYDSACFERAFIPEFSVTLWRWVMGSWPVCDSLGAPCVQDGRRQQWFLPMCIYRLGDYADTRHPYAVTSQRVVGILTPAI